MRVLYIDIDSLRADHVGAYGYDKPTTPNIDEFAEDAVAFRKGYTADSPCMPSRAAFLSGRYGIDNGITTHGPPSQVMNGPQWKNYGASDDEYYTVSELAFHNRVTAGAVSSFPRHPSPWFYNLWHEFHQPQEPPNSETDGFEYFQTPRGETVTDIGLDFLERNGDDDYFLYTQYWDPHSPYKRTDEQVERFRDTELPPYPTQEQIDDHQSWDAFRSATQMGIEDRDDLDELLANYDAEIRYVDEHVGRLLDGLKEHGLYDDTLVILTGDHGEEFGEHGLYREHWSTHDGTQKPPFLVKPPADTDYTPGFRDHLITNVDMAPTIADYGGLEAPGGWHGKSVRPAVEEDVDPDEWRDHIVFDHGLYTAQRAVRTDRWKFIRTYNPGMWPSVVPDRQLYDMEADPWEQDDLSDERPDVVDELETKMTEWAEEHGGPFEDSLKRTARIEPTGSKGYKKRYDGV